MTDKDTQTGPMVTREEFDALQTEMQSMRLSMAMAATEHMNMVRRMNDLEIKILAVAEDVIELYTHLKMEASCGRAFVK